jgi:hypothetical protein
MSKLTRAFLSFYIMFNTDGVGGKITTLKNGGGGREVNSPFFYCANHNLDARLLFLNLEIGFGLFLLALTPSIRST